MTSGPNFEFTMGASLSRRNFISEVYDKIVADFSAKMNIQNIGALSGSSAQENLKIRSMTNENFHMSKIFKFQKSQNWVTFKEEMYLFILQTIMILINLPRNQI